MSHKNKQVQAGGRTQGDVAKLQSLAGAQGEGLPARWKEGVVIDGQGIKQSQNQLICHLTS